PLTFLGSIQNGLAGDATLLTVKSVLDGFTAIALAATLGWGVLLTVPLILIYQGALAIGASLFVGVLTDLQLREMSAVGGLLLMGVGLRLLSVRDVRSRTSCRRSSFRRSSWRRSEDCWRPWASDRTKDDRAPQ